MPRFFSAHSLVESYTKLFDGAVKCSGNIEPYVQQLGRYDAREIRKYEDLIRLSREMSVKTLKSGMMSRMNEATILNRIQRFLDPKHTLSHGRPIFRADARQCGLRVRDMEARSEPWNTIYEVYLRTNNFVSKSSPKCIETTKASYFADVPRQ